MAWQYTSIEACKFAPIPLVLNELVAAYNERLESSESPISLDDYYTTSMTYLYTKIKNLLLKYINLTQVADTMTAYPSNWTLDEFYASYELTPLEYFGSQISFEQLHTMQVMLSAMQMRKEPFEGEILTLSSGVVCTSADTFTELENELKYAENNSTESAGKVLTKQRYSSGSYSMQGYLYLPEIMAEGFENRPCEVIALPQFVHEYNYEVQPFFNMDTLQTYYKQEALHTNNLSSYTPILPYSREDFEFITIEESVVITYASYLINKFIYNYACEDGFTYQPII